MKLLAFCLLLGMSGQGQDIHWDTTGAVTSCYARYSGLCQGSPLTAAEKAADEVEKQIDGLLLELGDRRDLSAADVLYIGETTRRRMFNGGEELLKNLQQIKKRAERAAERKFRDETDFAEAAQRSADETDGKPQEYQKPVDLYPIICGGSPPHPCNQPPAEPVDVPAVQKWREIYFSCMAPSLGHCTNSDCTDAWCVPRKEKQRYYTCADKSRVLLTDESGKKHCIKF